MDNKQLRRAGLDYSELASVKVYEKLDELYQCLPADRLYGCTTRAETLYTAPRYQPGDSLLFGPETRGLPDSVLADLPDDRKIRIPMQEQSRSLNLSNAVSIIAYEAWRQQQFAGFQD